MIRKANKSDIKQIAELFKQLHEYHVEIKEDYFRKPNDDFYIKELNEIFENNYYTLLVFEENKKIIGYAQIEFLERENEIYVYKKRCFINQFAVDKNHRRHSVGKKLIEEITSISHQKSCDSIELGVWYENYDAVDFYGEMGFVPRKYKMEMIL